MELSNLSWSNKDRADLEAVSSELTLRLPEFLTEFYSWLMSEEGGGAEYLRHDQVPRLTQLQHDYWRSFFSGDLDEQYIKSRSKVGHVHARIGLPAHVYLQSIHAMERIFMRSIKTIETLTLDQQNASFSAVQKLVRIDVSIVLEAFAAHSDIRLETQRRQHKDLIEFLRNLALGEDNQVITVADYQDDEFAVALNGVQSRFLKILESADAITSGNYLAPITMAGPNDKLGEALLRVRARLSEIASIAETVANGDLSTTLRVAKSDDALALAVNSMIESFRNVVQQVNCVASGDFSTQIAPRSKQDELGVALSLMGSSLRSTQLDNAQKLWLIEGINLINLELRGAQELSRLANDVLNTLCHLISATSGVIYVRKQDSDTFIIESAFAFDSERQPGTECKLGQGLVGQAALSKTANTVQLPPNDPQRLRSTFLDVSPHSLIIYPLVLSGVTIGVMEFAFIEAPDPRVHELLDLISENITIGLHNAITRSRTEQLLATAQTLSAELEIQQSELLATNHQLEAQSIELETSEQNARTQSAELETINTQLDDRNRVLEAQAEELEHRNIALNNASIELQRRSREIAQASKYKSDFLANMSHELRTPLNSVLLLSNHLAENRRGVLNKEEAESAQVIHRSGQALLNLIDEILDLAKIEAGHMNAVVSKQSVSSVIETVSDSMAPLAHEKNLEFSVSCPADLHLETDRTRIEQILRNLLSNAIKFTEEGAVTLAVSHHDAVAARESTASAPARLALAEHVCFRVTDTGPGVPENMTQTIFEAFQQADAGSSRRHGGTGLGLSISRQLAQLLGATLTLESTGPSGSSFELRHPINQALSPAPKLAGTPPPLHALSAPEDERAVSHATPWNRVSDDRENLRGDAGHLLIIDDDLAFATIVRDFFRKHGYSALVAASGEEGLALAREHQPSGVFLDIQLPDINGRQVLEGLKDDPRTRHIPVHFVSVENESIHLLSKGAVGFLQKPVDEADLERALAQLANTFSRAVKELLVVEDDEDMRLAIRKTLGNGDVRTTEVGSGEQCLRLLQETTFDCMILDLGLPDMTGFELLDKMKELLDTYPPVIVYTGRDLTEEQAERLRYFAESIIIKGARSEERLLDETSIFLHRVIDNLSSPTREILRGYHSNLDFLRGRRVLLVDDDMRNVFALSSILRDRGLEVVKAENGQRAVEILRTEQFDIVLMDLMMPVMDGLTAISIIRKELKLHALPIIALTAKAMPKDRSKCISAGATDYLTKPVDVDRLCTIMKVLIS